jgi:hypothetical protein
MGSWQVVSVNCPRAAYRAEGDDKRLFGELKLLMDIAVEVFHIKRRWMEIVRTNGRMPFAMQRPKDPNDGERGAVAVDLDGLVYTIGVVGVNEMVQHHTGKQLHESREAFRLAIRAMTEMELYGRELSKKNNMTIALARNCPGFVVLVGNAIPPNVPIENALFGGQMTTTEMIENYPGFPQGVTGDELWKAVHDHIGDPFFGVHLNPGHITSLEE